jgi:hypothetical protein
MRPPIQNIDGLNWSVRWIPDFNRSATKSSINFSEFYIGIWWSCMSLRGSAVERLKISSVIRSMYDVTQL